MKRCDGCKFWIKDREEDLDGNCRRNPPTPFLKMAINPITQQQGVIVLAYWPKTRPELWCGGYRGQSRFIRFYHFIRRVLEFLFGHTKASVAKDATTAEQRREECLTKEKLKNILTDVSSTRKSSLN
jgi:hypothetical protein